MSDSSTVVFSDDEIDPMTVSMDGMSIFYTNADNLVNKIDELKVRVILKRPDIIVITEVYPKSGESTDIFPSELNISGYNTFYSKVQKSSRGVIIYVKDSFTAEINDKLTNSKFQESVWVELYINNKDKVLIGGIYKSPNSTEENVQSLFCLLDHVNTVDFRRLLIIGDFNFPEIDWATWLTSTSENHNAFRFLECLRDNYFEQFVNTPTRWRDESPGNILDLILSDNIDFVTNIEITTRLGSSDHMCIKFMLDAAVDVSNRSINNKNYYRGNYQLAAEEVSRIDWLGMNDMDMQESWDYFYSNIRSIIDRYIPETVQKKQVKPVWMDMYCKHLIERKYKAWKRYTYSRSREDYLKYRKIRNKIPKSIHYAKKKYEKGIASDIKENPKSFWKYVRTKTQTRSVIGDIKDNHGQRVSNDKNKAEVMNNFFSSVFTVEDKYLPKCDLLVDNSICDVVVTIDKVKKLLKSLNVSKSAGPDEIHPRFLKELAEPLALPVTILFNKSLSEGRLPSMWKTANVTCIFKSGDRQLACNYRPISVTAILCRLLEKIVRNPIMDHCKDNKVFSNSQYGFREGRSCVLQLLKVFDDWTQSIDGGYPVDALYLDLKKAFDSVPHQRLLLKLKSNGISGNVLKWITNFLTNHKQRVTMNGVSSEWTNVTSGVPQGSVLGPLLFIIYINDLPNAVKSHCKLFADDAKLYRQIANIKDFREIQEDLFELCRWTIKWQLFFNLNKCKVLHLGLNNPQYEYKMTDMNGNLIDVQKVENEKDLGIIF